jgi:hypothetical protein
MSEFLEAVLARSHVSTIFPDDWPPEALSFEPMVDDE